MILDTTFIIDLLKNKANAVAKAAELEKSSFPIRTTTVNVFELWQGLEDIRDQAKKERIEQFLSSIGLLSLDRESAKAAGTIYGELKRKGELLEAEDCLIAGICLQHGDIILTRNQKHFERIKTIRVETY